MSWSIACMKNTLQVPEALEKQIQEITYGSVELYGGVIYFNTDHAEHMDYFSGYPGLLDLIAQNNLMGEVCFGDLESTNEGCFWGYSFDGAGHCFKLEGQVEWSPKVVPTPGVKSEESPIVNQGELESSAACATMSMMTFAQPFSRQTVYYVDRECPAVEPDGEPT
jgi:hypothetical protein